MRFPYRSASRVPMAVVLGIAALSALAACGDSSGNGESGSDSELTSVSGSQRTLTFKGMFYVTPGTSTAAVAAQAQAQAQAAFGALRTSNMVASSRYMTGIVPGSITRSPVNVLDTSKPAGTKGTVADLVTYMYKDVAIVPKTMTSSTFSTALLNPNYNSYQSVIRANCTPGQTEETGEPIWYSFDTSGAACESDISAEAAKIQSDRTHLPPPAGFHYPWITLTEQNRVFFPTVFALGPDTTNTQVSYPEYDQLYSGNGVEAGKLVVGIIGSYVTHKAIPAEAALQGKFVDASGNLTNDGWVFENFMSAVLLATAANSKFASTSTVSLAFNVNGHAYSFPNLLSLAGFASNGNQNQPAGYQSADYNALMQAIMDRVSKTWLTFEAPVTVTVTSGGATKSHPLSLKLQAYFGTDEEDTPVFKTAIKHNDVLGYMGHSYTGHGPYAPGDIVATDFPSTYQVMFWNGCVSYNYYDQSFFKLKAGGTKKLDLITNSIEGEFTSQEGSFAAAFFDGSLPTYTQILTRLEDSSEDFGSGNNLAYDPFRVVDGELDNVYKASVTPITVR